MARYFVKFDDPAMRRKARPMLDADPERFEPYFPQSAPHAPQILIADLSDEERKAAEANGATIYEDIQFYTTFPIRGPFEFRNPGWAYWELRSAVQEDVPVAARTTGPMAAGRVAPAWQSKTLRDVLDHIRAPTAWRSNLKGKGVTVGIVDTGISSSMPEFSPERRSSYSRSFAYANGPWVDHVGHGSMCASIAAGSKREGGRYDGVAPEAELLSARSNLRATDIYKLYD